VKAFQHIGSTTGLSTGARSEVLQVPEPIRAPRNGAMVLIKSTTSSQEEGRADPEC